MATDGSYKDQTPIRSYERLTESLRVYDWVRGAVPGLMDIDACLERKGSLLFLEGKHRRGTKVLVPLGQFLTLQALAEKEGVDVWLVAEAEGAKKGKSGGYSVAHITHLDSPDWKQREHGARMWGFYCRGPHAKKRGWIQTDVDGLRDMLREWWNEHE